MQWLAADTAAPVLVYRNNEITFDDILKKQPAGLILSPGPGHPTNPNDLGVCHDILTQIDQIRCPVLGVCLGMQALAAYSGARIVQAPHIMHGKTSMMDTDTESVLFAGLRSPQQVMRYHSWCVEEGSLPSEWKVTATTQPSEGEASVLMAIENTVHRRVGVQFHPESVGTPEGRSMLRNFLVYCNLSSKRSDEDVVFSSTF